jgi:hypothetical protein
VEQIFKLNEQQSGNEDRQILSEENEEMTSIANEIKRNINPRKAPGFNLTRGKILKQLPRKGVVKLTRLIKPSFRLKYKPQMWKIAEMIMTP